jgi:hypothetical protein
VETQVKEEEFERMVSTSPVRFDNLGDDDSDYHSTRTLFQPSTIIRPQSHPDTADVADVQRLLRIHAELEAHLQEEKIAREELISENDKLHKAQLQLQEQNSQLQLDCQLWNDRAVKVRGLYRTLQAEFQSLQERYEEKCRQLREHEMQHPQQEHVKQEHIDIDEMYHPLQSPVIKRQRDNVVNTTDGQGQPASSGMDVVVSDEHVKQEAVVGDEEAGDREPVTGEEDSGNESSDGEDDEDEDGGDSEEEDSDDRPSKR